MRHLIVLLFALWGQTASADLAVGCGELWNTPITFAVWDDIDELMYPKLDATAAFKRMSTGEVHSAEVYINAIESPWDNLYLFWKGNAQSGWWGVEGFFSLVWIPGVALEGDCLKYVNIQ